MPREDQGRIREGLCPPAADFFVESVCFFLKVVLGRLDSSLTVASEKNIVRRRGSMRPDISIWRGETVLAAIECKVCWRPSVKTMYPPAYPHDELQLLYPDVYLLHGSIKMGPGMRMNRNMIILKDGEALTLVNPVRMSESGLASLDCLGTVKHIIRLGDFHGLDDAFYCDRYQCEFWAQAGQDTYKTPVPTNLIAANTESPFPNSVFFIFEQAKYPEAALFVKEHRLLITTDSVQYHDDWSYFTWFTKTAFKLLGFKMGLNIGPPWLKRVMPKGGSLKGDFERLLTLDFNAIIAAHGLPLKSDAKKALSAELSNIFQ